MARRSLICTFVLGLVLASTGSVHAAGSLGTLLDEIAPPREVAEGGVVIDAWVERTGTTPEIVITLRPEGAVKLVADPGITVTPVGISSAQWLTDMPQDRVDEGQDYFDQPPMLRLPFAAEDGQPIELRIDYAYCIIDYQCLFGEETLSVATRTP